MLRPDIATNWVNLTSADLAKAPVQAEIGNEIRAIALVKIWHGEDGVLEDSGRVGHPRQVVQREMRKRGMQCQCIRCREIRNMQVDAASLRLGVVTYATDATTEQFLSYITPEGKMAGFLRLSIRHSGVPGAEVLEELRDSAVIREVHVYGPALELGESSRGEAQHLGLGTRLIEQASNMARQAGSKRITVISAIGTREYYRRLGFERGELYMARSL